MTGMFERLMEGSGRTARPQQTLLAKYAREAIASETGAFVQAGTGTGKSWLILAIALEAAQANKAPSVVVCPTNNLIDQYVNQDVPEVRKILGGTFSYIKGRNNYLCTQSAAARKMKPSDANRIYQEARQKGFMEWSQAGLEGWGCTGDCNPLFDDLCALQDAKKEAQKSDVIVTNGHVLLWDLKVNQMTGGAVNLLPSYQALFIDECHEIDGVVKNCNSDSIGENSTVYDVVHGFKDWVLSQEKKLVKMNEVLVDSSQDEELHGIMEEAVREAGRVESLLAGMEHTPENQAEIKELRKDLKALQRAIDFCTSGDKRFISTISKELDKEGSEVLVLNRRCVDGSSWTRQILTQQPSVLVSGTIPGSLPARLGLGSVRPVDVGTPFNYQNSVLAISPFDPKNQDDEWKRIQEVCGAVVDMARRPHEQGGGGTLILFTSWKDMELVMPIVHKALVKAGLRDIPVFMQTKGDPQETARDLAEFKKHGHGVMGGVQSMWTGVDVPGEALRQVIIYRLPWAVPTLEVKATQALFGYKVYEDDMMTRLVQGIGRLVRQVQDNGRIIISDSRAKKLRWKSNGMSKHIAEFSPFGR